MKKNVLNISVTLTAISLITLGFINYPHISVNRSAQMNCHPPAIQNLMSLYPSEKVDLIYEVEPRFLSTITKEKLTEAKSIIDILPKEGTNGLSFYHDVKVALLNNREEVIVMGKNELLNSSQIELLQSAEYSTNFYINANTKKRNNITDELEDYFLVYYMTIIPENQAKCINGLDSFINYIKGNLKEKTTNITKQHLQPGKVKFTVSKNGNIENVQLESTSGYPEIDNELIKLLANTPQQWEPASNSKGEKVDEELVFFFGLKGC